MTELKIYSTKFVTSVAIKYKHELIELEYKARCTRLNTV